MRLKMSSEYDILYASGMHRIFPSIFSFMHPELNRLTYLFLVSFHSFFPHRVLGSYQNKIIVGFIPQSKAAVFANLTLDFLRHLNNQSLVGESRKSPSVRGNSQ